MKPGEAEAIFPYSQLEKIAIQACPVCGCQTNISKRRTDRYGYGVPFVQCRKCSLGYLAEHLTREGYDRLYSGAYRALIRACHGRAGLGSEPRTTVNGCWGGFAARTFPPPITSILDVGGSNGLVAQGIAARFNNATVTVLDPALQELPVGAIRGYAEDPIPGTYDLAICIATADHLTNPLRVFRNLRKSAPRLLIDYLDVWLQWMLGISQVIKIDHPLYWTQVSIAHALDQTGWKPISGMTLCRKSNREYRATLLACERKE